VLFLDRAQQSPYPEDEDGGANDLIEAESLPFE
jgi:hypothetical protein